MDYDADTGDRLLEHYATALAKDEGIELPLARARIDMSGPTFYAFLGRMTDNDEAHGYSGRYVELRALSMAGIATEDEMVEWAQVRGDAIAAEYDGQDDEQAAEPAPAGDYDPDAPPVALEAADEQQAQLLRLLWQLRRISHAKDALDAQRETILEEAVELHRAIGRPVTLVDPLTGVPLIAGVRQAERLKVNYGQLVRYVGQQVADSVCKPREVDTKEDGLFHQAVQNLTIPREVVPKVARYDKAKPYIGFTGPKKR